MKKEKSNNHTIKGVARGATALLRLSTLGYDIQQGFYPHESRLCARARAGESREQLGVTSKTQWIEIQAVNLALSAAEQGAACAHRAKSRSSNPVKAHQFAGMKGNTVLTQQLIHLENPRKTKRSAKNEPAIRKAIEFAQKQLDEIMQVVPAFVSRRRMGKPEESTKEPTEKSLRKAERTSAKSNHLHHLTPQISYLVAAAKAVNSGAFPAAVYEI